MTNQMHLGAFIYAAGHHAGGWRYPDNELVDLLDLDYYKKIAKDAEKGKFDLIFFADRLAIPDRYQNNFDASIRHFAPFRLDPILLITAIASVTENIGLVATASTTYNDPFSIARSFATIDHLSAGRAAWNVVTSTNDGEAHNYSKQQHLDHAVRYERAQEFLEVVVKLWDSWEKDALVVDREKGIYSDPDKVHYVNHIGKFFNVKGPLNVPRPPQGRPVIVQAGSSERGREFAARWGEIIFTSQPEIEAAKDFYADIKSRTEKAGRNSSDIKILPGIMPIIGTTEKEAQEKEKLLRELVHPIAGLSLLSDSLNHDMSQYNLNEEFPELTSFKGNKSRQQLISKMAKEQNLTLAQLGKLFGASRSHRIIVGTPLQIAESMEKWFKEKACDGFNIMPPYLPNGLSDFVEQVVPILQKKGIFKEQYNGNNLRENLGLSEEFSYYYSQN